MCIVLVLFKPFDSKTWTLLTSCTKYEVQARTCGGNNRTPARGYWLSSLHPPFKKNTQRPLRGEGDVEEKKKASTRAYQPLCTPRLDLHAPVRKWARTKAFARGELPSYYAISWKSLICFTN